MDATRAALRRKFIAMQSHLRKQEKSQINNITLHPTATRGKRTNKVPSQ